MADYIGDYWCELDTRVTRLLVVQHEMNLDQRAFLNDLRDRLARYKERSYISVRQMEWVDALERQFLEGHHAAR